MSNILNLFLLTKVVKNTVYFGYNFLNLNYIIKTKTYIMNDKVDNLIRQAKESKKQEEIIARENHLRSIGLIDENKTTRAYANYYSESSKFDQDKGLYYKEVVGVIDVTDEEYEQICKYFPPKIEEVELIKTDAEKTIGTIAFVNLCCGIIISVMGVIYSLYCFANLIDHAPLVFFITIMIFLSTMITWAIMTIIRDISINIRQIASKIK
jgi:hypothetical protein